MSQCERSLQVWGKGLLGRCRNCKRVLQLETKLIGDQHEFIIVSTLSSANSHHHRNLYSLNTLDLFDVPRHHSKNLGETESWIWKDIGIKIKSQTEPKSHWTYIVFPSTSSTSSATPPSSKRLIAWSAGTNSLFEEKLLLARLNNDWRSSRALNSDSPGDDLSEDAMTKEQSEAPTIRCC